MNKKKILALTVLFFSLYASQSLAEKVQILNLKIFYDAQFLVMSTKANLNLNENIVEALDSNILIPFRIEVKLTRNGFFRFKRKIQLKTFNFTLAKYALGDQYVVTDQQSGTTISFPTLEKAKQHLENRQRLIIAEKKSLVIQKPTEVAIRWRLMRSGLPIPMLLPTLFSSQWNLDSGWNFYRI